MGESYDFPMFPAPADDFAAGLIRSIGDVVSARPGAMAVSDDRRVLSYRELACEAVATMDAVRGAVGRVMIGPAGGQRRGIVTAQPIAVLHRHQAGAVAAILGVLASGHPLLVLDPDSPVPRLKHFMNRVGATVCIADAANATTASQIAEHVIRPVAGQAARVHRAERLWVSAPPAASPALLAFTSGSTGVPKVVVCDHRQLLSDAWANGLGSGCYGPDDLIAHALPLAFYAGLLATLGGLVAGAGMSLHDVRVASVTRLAGWLKSSRATVLHASPAILRGLVATRPQPDQLAHLRTLTIAGEAAYGRDIEAARRLLPAKCAIFNRYGSAETGLVTDFKMDSTDPLPEGPIPAGKPIGSTRLAVLGPNGEPLPAGAAGTLTITRRHLALGYLNDPEATAAMFSDNPDGTRTCHSSDLGRFDDQGRLHLLGRRDHSVKIGGFLMEPGEVDAALFALPEVREALVVGTPDPRDGVVRLVAYVVPAVQPLTRAGLRAALLVNLPAQMVPEVIVFLESLPRTERGKLDRAALPRPPVQARRFATR